MKGQTNFPCPRLSLSCNLLLHFPAGCAGQFLKGEKMKTPRILSRPIQEWPQSIPKDTQELERELSALIQRAALLEAYVAHRYNTGCGDQGHAASAKVANRTLVKVRKALGFSYPENAGISIQG